MTGIVTHLFKNKPSYLEQKDPMLAARLVILWNKPGFDESHGRATFIWPESFLLGMIDAFSVCGEGKAAAEISFLLELWGIRKQLEIDYDNRKSG